jgi:REP element-mobilizing transposase RayT
MRRARIKVAAELGDAVYHLISRTVNGEWLLGPTGKEVLRRQMWQVADFAGLEILTYAILSNHFHILVRVPRKVPVSDAELLRRYGVLYPTPTKYQMAKLEVIGARLRANGPEAEAWRKRQLALMNDVSAFMKLLKERFSIWHNKSHQRFGPVWSDRFKSVLVDPQGRTIATMAAYIDLNCVRAGIAKDPKDYRWCGYAEAMGGRAKAQQGIALIAGAPWAHAQAAYRQLLFAAGSHGRANGAAAPADIVRRVAAEGGKLPLPDVLRCRIRYFTEGAVLGGRVFVESQLARYRHLHGAPRMAPPSLPTVTDWGEIVGLRRFRGPVFG